MTKAQQQEEKPSGKQKEASKVIATRIPISLLNRLRNKHPNSGDTQKLLKTLVERYLDGKVLGIRLT